MNDEDRHSVRKDFPASSPALSPETNIPARLEWPEGGLIQSEERYRRLVELSPDMILLHSQGRYVYANPAAVRILGASRPEELVGKPVLEMIHPEFREKVKDRVQRLEQGKEVSPLEEKFIRLDGAEIDVEVAAAPLFFQDKPMVLVVGRDITERKRAAEALRESEERYRAIVETTAAGTMILEEDMTISLINSEFERRSGFSREEIEGKRLWTDFFLPEELGKMAEYPRAGAIDGAQAPATYESRFLTRSGKVLDVLVTVGMIPGTKKSVASFLEITPLKRAKEEVARLANENAILVEIGRIISSTLNIEEVYERFAQETRRLIQVDRISVNILNPDHQTFTHSFVSGVDVLYRRQGDVLSLTGTGVEEVVRTRSSLWIQGNNLEEMVRRFPGLLPAFRAGFQSIILAPLIGKDQVIGVLNFQSLKPGAYAFADVKLAEGISAQIAGAMANAQLFAEVRRAEEALRASEEKYRTLVDHATDAIFILQDEKVKFPNPKTLSLSGYSAEELSRTPFITLIHAEDREAALDQYQKRIRGEDVPTIQTYRVINKGGEELWAQINSVPITWEGRPATLNFVRDMTREKKLEVQFQHAQKMEAVGTLAGGIAHDFNNLLMGIQGYVSLMLFDLHPENPIYENLKKIEEQVKHGANLAGQLLAFARRGKYEVKISDLNKIIQHTSAIFERTKKEIQIHRKYQEGIWAVEVDRSQIEQVIMNLCVNAWQAMPDGGDLFLETKNVTLGPDYIKPFFVEPGNYVRISVRDTGVGMDQKTQQRIFEPFFTTKEMGRGTGLGLASVYGIIKNHGGFINVYSEKGYGTNFSIYLPGLDKKVAEEKKSPGEILSGKETILLVDDEPTIIEVMEKALTLTGYRVLVARGGEEALELYRQNRSLIDVVVLDMIMPGMNGGKVFDRLRQTDPGVKVILSSGYSIDSEASQIMARGCNGFIQKPFGIKELSQKIQEIMEKP